MDEAQNISREQALRRADRLANLMDTRFRIPGTGFRFGIDPLISLLPIAGDTAMLLVGLYPVFEAVRLKLGAGVVLRMLLNLGIDWLVGLVPLIGFIPDAVYKANLRNAILLKGTIERDLESRRIDPGG